MKDGMDSEMLCELEDTADVVSIQLAGDTSFPYSFYGRRPLLGHFNLFHWVSHKA